MVSTTQAEFLSKVRVYVTNVGYPSIHVYTSDTILIDHLMYEYNARKAPHRGTFDMIISKRGDIEKAARYMRNHGTRQQMVIAATLLRYCNKASPESRLRVARQLARQLDVINGRLRP